MRHQAHIDRFLAVTALIGILCVSIMYSIPIGRCVAAIMPAEKGQVLPVGKVTTDLNVQVSTDNLASTDPTGPTVTSVSARQRTDGSRLVDIYYSVTNPSPALVRVDVSVDNVYSTYASYFSGEFGSYILPGGQRHVVWDAGANLPNVTGSYRARVRASQTGNYYNYGERVSSYFSINNGVGDTTPRPPRAVGVSPYDNNAGWNLIRCQLHAHSKPDKQYIGAEISPEAQAWLYSDAGFRCLALTNHDALSGASLGSAAPSIAWAPHSAELSLDGSYHPHVLAIGTNTSSISDLEGDSRQQDEVTSVKTRVGNVKAHGGLAYIAHPDSRPYAMNATNVCKVIDATCPDGMGVYAPGNDSQGMWSSVLKTGRRVWGYAEEDFHPQAFSWNLGKAWVSVPDAGVESWATIKEKLAKGNYYIYWMTAGTWDYARDNQPPRLRVTVSQAGQYPAITASMQDWSGAPFSPLKIEFLGADGKPLCGATGSGNTYTYNCRGTEKFVRVRVSHKVRNGCAFVVCSQPIRANPKDSSNQPASAASSLASSSPELCLRYLSDEECPVPPLAGFVGYAFSVTTADGQMPPNATLSLSFDGEDLAALGGTQYLAIYRYDDAVGEWTKIGGTVSFASATIESPITQLGKYCISADLPADDSAPEVVITAPQASATISQNTTVSVNVNDNIGVWRVSFFVNDTLICEDADASDAWSATIPYADYCTGDYTLKAVAEDMAGNRGEAEIPVHIVSSTPRPTVTITSPSSGSVLSGAVTATGTCWDDVAVASVTLRAGSSVIDNAQIDGGGWTCDINTSLLASGNRTITATVEDYWGNSATASVPVVLNGGVLSPIGSIKTVPDGQTVGFGNAVVVAANATVGNGFYAETIDRSSGIRVVTDQVVKVGDIVSAAGTSAIENGERAVRATDVAVTSSDHELPRPLFVRGSRLLAAPDSVGKIVKVSGRVGRVDSANPARWFMLDDPSGVSIKCVLPEGVMMNPDWESMPVTGVASFEDSGNGFVPKILMVSPGATITGVIGEPGLNGDPWVLVNNQGIESPHPYFYNYYNQWILPGPFGTTRMRAHFSQLGTSSSDYLYVADPSWYAYESFGWGTYQDRWSNWINGDKLLVYMQAYSSGGYGFKLDKYEAELPGFTPLQGIEVTLSPGGQTTFTVADGTYRFDGLPTGSYVVTPSTAGKTFTPSSRSVEATSNQTMSGVDFAALTNRGRLRGVVTQRTNVTTDYVLDSPHPYSDNCNNAWTIYGPANAARMRVHFTKIELESGYDFVYVSDPYWNKYQQLSKGTPLSDVWSDWVDGNRLLLSLQSDYSIDYYGFQVDKYEVEFQDEPLAGVTLTLTPGNLVKASSEDGSYSFDSLAVGSYVVTPSLAGTTFAPASRSATLTQNQDLAGLDFLKN